MDSYQERGKPPWHGESEKWQNRVEKFLPLENKHLQIQDVPSLTQGPPFQCSPSCDSPSMAHLSLRQDTLNFLGWNPLLLSNWRSSGETGIHIRCWWENKIVQPRGEGNLPRTYRSTRGQWTECLWSLQFRGWDPNPKVMAFGGRPLGGDWVKRMGSSKMGSVSLQKKPREIPCFGFGFPGFQNCGNKMFFRLLSQQPDGAKAICPLL